jgi:hypothetical protein
MKPARGGPLNWGKLRHLGQAAVATRVEAVAAGVRRRVEGDKDSALCDLGRNYAPAVAARKR